MDDRDLGERMERLARRVDGAAPPDLYVARARAARRRTRSALVVGLSVSLIGSVLAFAAFRSRPHVPAPEQPDWTLPANPAVWPLPGAYGDAPWREDPEQVVCRFVQTVLGWGDPGIQNIDAIVEATRPGSFFDVTPEPCPETARCPSLLVVADEVEAGRWSVVSVWTRDLAPGLPGDDVVSTLAGGTVAFDLTLPEDRSAHVGLVATNGCRDVSSFEIGLEAGSFELPVPEPVADDPACSDIGAGYVFAYATDDTTVPIGDPLLEAAAIEYPWLTVVPIHLVMEAPRGTADPAPGVLEVTCSIDGTTAAGTSVTARPDGVHLDIESVGSPVSLAIDEDQRIFFDGVPGELILPLEPGQHAVECIVSNADEVRDPRPFEVLDPEGYWVDPALGCEDQVSTDLDGWIVDAGEDPSAALLLAAESLLRPHLGTEGLIRFGGYPDASSDVSRSAVLIDDERVVRGRVDFSLHRDGWVIDSYGYCTGPRPDGPTVGGALDITCDVNGVTLDTDVVVAGPDGVGVYTHPYNQRVRLVFDALSVDERIETLVVDYYAAVLDLPPGSHTVGCLDGDVVNGEATFEVLDPGGFWVDPSLACSNPASVVLNSGDLGTKGDPTDEMVAWAAGWRTPGQPPLPDGGSFQPVGYPEARETRLLGYRSEGGDLVARFEFCRAGTDWRPDGVLTCEYAVIF